MYTERERIWIDLSDIFCEDESYLTIVAEKIMAYCTYTIEKIKYIFFYEVAPVCKFYEGIIDHGFGFDEKILIRNINKMLNSHIWMIYNKIFYFKDLQKTCKKQWEGLERELIDIGYNNPHRIL